MQQIYLTGEAALSTAMGLFGALSLRPVGYRLMPLVIGGRERGRLMHLLTPGCAAGQNDLPCVLRLSERRSVTIHEVLDEVAAPLLRRSPTMRAPILLDALTADALAAPAFLEAVALCLRSSGIVVAIVASDAVAQVRTLTDPVNQLWVHCTPQNAEAEMVRLQEELAMRM